MLFDERKNPFHLMLRDLFNSGGLEAFFKTFEWLATGVAERNEETGETSGPQTEFLDAWLSLLEKMVNPKMIIETPHTMASKSISAINYTPFDPVQYLVYVHKRAFDAIDYLWVMHSRKSFSDQTSDHILSILCHLLKGETIINEHLKKETEAETAATGTNQPIPASTTTSTTTTSSSTGSANQPPAAPRSEYLGINPDHMQQLTDMGFAREAVVDALSQCQTIEQATEFLLSTPQASSNWSSSSRPAEGTNTTTGPNAAQDVDMVSAEESVPDATGSGTTTAPAAGSSSTTTSDMPTVPPAGQTQATTNLNKQAAQPPKPKREEPLSKARIDTFTDNLLPGSLRLMDELPSTVYKICDLILTVAFRNGETWCKSLLKHLLSDIVDNSKRLLEMAEPLRAKDKKSFSEWASQLKNAPEANKVAVRVHLYSLLFDEMKIPCAELLHKSNAIDCLVSLLEVGLDLFSLSKDYSSSGPDQTSQGSLEPTLASSQQTPKWLAPTVLLIDLYEKGAIASHRRAPLLNNQQRTWLYFDERSGRWTSHVPANNKIIDDAYKNGEQYARYTVGRKHYLAQFSSMLQINEDTSNLRPIMMTLVPNPPDKMIQDEDELIPIVPRLREHQTKTLVRVCVGFMQLPIDPNSLQAVMRLSFRITRDYELAVMFVKMGGIRALQNLPETSQFSGFVSLATLIIRHVLEEPAVLHQTMEKVIRSTTQHCQHNQREMHYLLRVLGAAACRNEDIFKKLTTEILRISPSLFNRRDEDDPRSKPEGPQLIKVLPPKPSPEPIKPSSVTKWVIADLLDSLTAPIQMKPYDLGGPVRFTTSPASPTADKPPQMGDPSAFMGRPAPPAPFGSRSGSMAGSSSGQPPKPAGEQPGSSDVPSQTPIKQHNPLMNHSTVLRLLAELTRSYSVVPKIIVDHTFAPTTNESINEEVSALAFILDNILPTTQTHSDRDGPSLARVFLASLAACNHCVEAQIAVVNEVKASLNRAASLPESCEKHARLQSLAGIIGTMIDCCPAISAQQTTSRNSAQQQQQQQQQLSNNIVRLFVRKGLVTDLAKIPHSLDLSAPHMYATVNAILKPLETLSRFVNLPSQSGQSKHNSSQPKKTFIENSSSSSSGEDEDATENNAEEVSAVDEREEDADDEDEEEDEDDDEDHVDDDEDHVDDDEDHVDDDEDHVDDDEDPVDEEENLNAFGDNQFTDDYPIYNGQLNNMLNDIEEVFLQQSNALYRDRLNFQGLTLADSYMHDGPSHDQHEASAPSLPPPPGNVGLTHPLLLRRLDHMNNQGAIQSTNGAPPVIGRAHRYGRPRLLRGTPGVGGSQWHARHPSQTILQQLLGPNTVQEVMTLTNQIGLGPGRLFVADFQNWLAAEDELYTEHADPHTLTSPHATALASIPLVMARWTEESRILDGGTLHDCLANIKQEIVATLEKYEEEENQDRQEKRKKMIEDEEQAQQKKCKEPGLASTQSSNGQSSQVQPPPNVSDREEVANAEDIQSTPQSQSSSQTQSEETTTHGQSQPYELTFEVGQQQPASDPTSAPVQPQQQPTPMPTSPQPTEVQQTTMDAAQSQPAASQQDVPLQPSVTQPMPQAQDTQQQAPQTVPPQSAQQQQQQVPQDQSQVTQAQQQESQSQQLQTPTPAAQTGEENPPADNATSANMESEIPDGVDPSFLAALPEDIRQEVLAEQWRLRRLERANAARQAAAANPTADQANNEASTSGTAPTATGASFPEVNPEFLAALPAEVQEEVLAQQRAEQQRQAATTSNPDQPVDPAIFIQTLAPNLRRQVLADMDDSLLSLLPTELAAEALLLRREYLTSNASANSTLSRLLRTAAAGRIQRARYTIAVPDHVHNHQSSWSWALERPTGTLAHGNSSSRNLMAALSRDSKFKGRQLLDSEALTCLMILLFVQDQRLNIARLHRVLRNLSYHQQTRQWIVQSMLSIIERSRLSDETSRNNGLALTDSKKSPSKKDSVSGQETNKVNHSSSWLSISMDAALGCRASVFAVPKLPNSKSAVTPVSGRCINIHSQAAPAVCRHMLETLITLAKSFPQHFFPEGLQSNEEANNDSDSSTNNLNPDFFEILAKLDSFLSNSGPNKKTRSSSKATPSSASALNTSSSSSGATQQSGLNLLDANEASSSLARLMGFLAHPIIKRSPTLTDRLLHLLALISIAFPVPLDSYSYEPWTAAPPPDPVRRPQYARRTGGPPGGGHRYYGIHGHLHRPIGGVSHPPPLPPMGVHTVIPRRMEGWNQAGSGGGASGGNPSFHGAPSRPNPDAHMATESDNNNSATPKPADKNASQQSTSSQPAVDTKPKQPLVTKACLKLAVDVLTSKSCSEEGLDDVTSLLSRLSKSCNSTRATVLELLMEGARQLGRNVCMHISTLKEELKECNQKLRAKQAGPSSGALAGPSVADGSSPNAKGLVHDRFTNDAVVITAPLGSKGGREVQLPSMAALTSKNSSQAFFLRILKVIIQLRDTSGPKQPTPMGNQGNPSVPSIIPAANTQQQVGETEQGRSDETNNSNQPLDAAQSSSLADNIVSIAVSAATADAAAVAASSANAAAGQSDMDVDASSISQTNEVTIKVEEPVVAKPEDSLSIDLQLDDLWDTLSDCLLELADTPDNHAVLVLQPAVETFFLVHSPGFSQKAGHRAHDEHVTERNSQTAHIDQEVAPISPSDNPQASEAIGQVTSLSYDTEKFLKFAETHRVVLNHILRQSTTHLSQGPFAVLVDHTRVLDFDVKRRYFRQELERLDEGIRRDDLGIHVRRDNVFEESFRELHRRTAEEWKNRFFVVFEEEEGQDAGGLLREWYTIISREIFNPMYALFTTSPGDRVTYMINSASHCNTNHLTYFKFVGRVIAKAIYDNKLLDCYFTRSFYKHILGKSVKYTDMESEDYSFYQGLVFLLEHDVKELGYELTFSVEVREFGVTEVRELKPGGANIPVTEENKHEYVRLVCQEKMTGSIRKQLSAFLDGFYDIIPKRLISIFNEQELELLISGLPNIDIDDLKASTEYHKYLPNSLQIQWFWRALRSFDQADRAKLLQFVTGTSKVPLQGFASLEGMNGVQKFQIHRDERSTDRLPSAHTCFNQLDLPVYETYDKLRYMLLKAIQECSEGFGLA